MKVRNLSLFQVFVYVSLWPPPTASLPTPLRFESIITHKTCPSDWVIRLNKKQQQKCLMTSGL